MGRLSTVYTTAAKIKPRVRKYAGNTHIHGNFHWDNTSLRLLRIDLKKMSIEVHDMYFNGYDDICIEFKSKEDEFVFDLSFDVKEFDEHLADVRQQRDELRRQGRTP